MRHMNRLVAPSLAILVASACGGEVGHKGPAAPDTGKRGEPERAGTEPAVSALQRQLAAMEPTRATPPSDEQRQLMSATEAYLNNNPTRRQYLHLDKPLYQPGETIWFRAWELATRSFELGESGARVELVGPDGSTVLDKRVQSAGGVTANDFDLPPSLPGGEYKLRLTSDHWGTLERSVIISSYEPPRIKKQAEFLRKAYGAGDTVRAAVSVHRATGEPLAGHKLTALVVVDGAEVARTPVDTNAEGKAVVQFELPERMARGDGLLTVLVEEGGVTESLQKRIPITLKRVGFEMFPEGGQLVAGLPGRVYFAAKNALGKPADVEGRLIDASGKELAHFASLHNGMGRFDVIPEQGRKYFVEITKPSGIAGKFEVPAPEESGCSMQAVDDFTTHSSDVRVGVWCTEKQNVVATAMLRERQLDTRSVDVPEDGPALIALPVPQGLQGALRVTLFDAKLRPLTERLVYRGRGEDLRVTMTTDRRSYSPRDPVELTVRAQDGAGRPVVADLSLAVVDDTVLSFADDKTAHLLARVYLESEMPGQEIEEPNFYFSDDKKAGRALDLVLGTQGYRHFDWEPVLNPPPPAPELQKALIVEEAVLDEMEAEAPRDDRAPLELRRLARPAPAAAAPPPAPEPTPQVAQKPMPAVGKVAAKRKLDVAGLGRGRLARRELRALQMAGPGWAPVREFPLPNYSGRYDGPRTDFRETIFWAPSVKTNEKGMATVRFNVSDAVTSFRAIAEGVSAGGMLGRGETLVQSKLPVSLAVTLPLEVSAGDVIALPVLLSNDSEREHTVSIASQFGNAFRVAGRIPSSLTLKAGERKSFKPELTVVGNGRDPKAGTVRIAIEASHLEDEVQKTIAVVPLGFPRELSASGTVADQREHSVDLTGAVAGSIEASVTLYPSPLATMVQGMDAIIREPYGCFEQASSANYPNIMVLQYLDQHDAVDPAIIERASGMLDRGYDKLIGYESPKQGYEWFGGDPGHEALTAYGLMEFVDMKRVYSNTDQAMIDRTRRWLKARRAGGGTFKRNDRALDSFGAAAPEVTNGYIAYALSETGDKQLEPELAHQQQVARSTKDPYVMALAANVLVNLEPEATATQAAIERLVKMQHTAGGFPGADHSITRSGGVALEIETTALAAMALMKASKQGGEFTGPVRKAIEWLNGHRDGFGGFASTQSTVLALKALATYAELSKVTQASGTVRLRVNGHLARTVSFDKGHRGTLVLDAPTSAFKPGKNVVAVELDSQKELPYSLAVLHRSQKPASSPRSAVALTTRLTKHTVPVGESVRMNVEVRNVTDSGIPMTLARVGLPGGLTFQTWQLKELRDKQVIDYYETGPREVVLYFRSLAPHAKKSLSLDLMARVPGKYVAPASQAYLYYTDEYRAWVDPVRVEVR